MEYRSLHVPNVSQLGLPTKVSGSVVTSHSTSPVRQVNYNVEAARLGQMTDYDKLTLEVWTNGEISPKDAVGQAPSC